MQTMMLVGENATCDELLLLLSCPVLTNSLLPDEALTFTGNEPVQELQKIE